MFKSRTSRIRAVLPAVIEWLRGQLSHDRTLDSTPSRFVMLIDLHDAIRAMGGSGIVAAVEGVLRAEGLVRSPAGTFQTVEDGRIVIHCADTLSAHIEIHGSVFDPRHDLPTRVSDQQLALVPRPC